MDLIAADDRFDAADRGLARDGPVGVDLVLEGVGETPELVPREQVRRRVEPREERGKAARRINVHGLVHDPQPGHGRHGHESHGERERVRAHGRSA